MFTFRTVRDETRSSSSDKITGSAETTEAAIAGARELTDYTATDVEILDGDRRIALVPAVLWGDE